MKTPKSMIAALRKKGYSQDVIANKTKISQMTISRWSREDPTRPSTAAVKRLTKFYEKVRDEGVTL